MSNRFPLQRPGLNGLNDAARELIDEVLLLPSEDEYEQDSFEDLQFDSGEFLEASGENDVATLTDKVDPGTTGEGETNHNGEESATTLSDRIDASAERGKFSIGAAVMVISDITNEPEVGFVFSECVQDGYWVAFVFEGRNNLYFEFFPRADLSLHRSAKVPWEGLEPFNWNSLEALRVTLRRTLEDGGSPVFSFNLLHSPDATDPRSPQSITAFSADGSKWIQARSN